MTMHRSLAFCAAALCTSMGSGCVATVLSEVAAVELAWTFRDARSCDEADVAHVSVLAAHENGTTTARWFPCDATHAALVVPAGPARLFVEGLDAQGATRYTAAVDIDVAARRSFVVGEVVLAPMKTGDLLIQVALARLCAADIIPATVVVMLDGEIAAPPIREPLCNVDAHVGITDLAPGSYLVEVIGMADDGSPLFHESVTATVTAGMVSVVVVDIGAGNDAPRPAPAPLEQEPTTDVATR